MQDVIQVVHLNDDDEDDAWNYSKCIKSNYMGTPRKTASKNKYLVCPQEVVP